MIIETLQISHVSFGWIYEEIKGSDLCICKDTFNVANIDKLYYVSASFKKFVKILRLS